MRELQDACEELDNLTAQARTHSADTRRFSFANSLTRLPVPRAPQCVLSPLFQTVYITTGPEDPGPHRGARQAGRGAPSGAGGAAGRQRAAADRQGGDRELEEPAPEGDDAGEGEWETGGGAERARSHRCRDPRSFSLCSCRLRLELSAGVGGRSAQAYLVAAFSRLYPCPARAQAEADKLRRELEEAKEEADSLRNKACCGAPLSLSCEASLLPSVLAPHTPVRPVLTSPAAPSRAQHANTTPTPNTTGPGPRAAPGPRLAAAAVEPGAGAGAGGAAHGRGAARGAGGAGGAAGARRRGGRGGRGGGEEGAGRNRGGAPGCQGARGGADALGRVLWWRVSTRCVEFAQRGSRHARRSLRYRHSGNTAARATQLT